MKRKVSTKTTLKGDALTKAIKQAQKDPQFMKELRAFIKATTS